MRKAVITGVVTILGLVSSVSCQINWNLSASPNKCVREKQEVTLICSYDGAPGEVEKGIWLRNREEIYYFDPLRKRGVTKGGSAWDGRSDVVHVGNNDTSFEIKFPMRMADEGNYTCSIEVLVNTQVDPYSTEKYVSLSVSVPPSDPQIQVVGNKLVCTSDGGIHVPPPTFSWSPTPTGTVNTTDTTSTISTDGRSSYTCTVKHCMGQKSVSHLFETTTEATTASSATKPTSSSGLKDPNDSEKNIGSASLADKPGAIIGIVIAAVAGVVIIILVIVFVQRRKRAAATKEKLRENPTDPERREGRTNPEGQPNTGYQKSETNVYQEEPTETKDKPEAEKTEALKLNAENLTYADLDHSQSAVPSTKKPKQPDEPVEYAEVQKPKK